MRSSLGCLLILIVIGVAGYLFGRDYVRDHPQDVPWTRLELGDPVGRFTVRKLTRLGGDPAECRALLDRAGLEDDAVPPRLPNAECGYEDGTRLQADGARDIAFRPAGVVTSCPVAAALFLFEDRVVQSAAQRHLGSRVTAIDHAGSYSCRRLYGRAEGRFSEHATADAIDVIGFRLADGTRVSVLGDWQGDGARAAFLREVRNGACGLFATVLSPDYNAAHADHLHLDMARRGEMGWSLCR